MKDACVMSDIAKHIWESKYCYRDGDIVHESSIEDSWRRVAGALASVEASESNAWAERFYEALTGFKFIPAGRILAGAGTGHQVTLFNCFVMGTIEDSMAAIFDSLKEAALTMQQGGGVGYDFSTLRPHGIQAHTKGTIASGPVSFMRIWDAMCETLLSTGARRGAMMATLRCDHPDIERYIDAKRDPQALTNFNLSVQVSDAFMQAVADDETWPLVFPEAQLDLDNGDGSDYVMRHWPSEPQAVRCRILKKVPARQLWEEIMRATYDSAEPGVLFVDRINRQNNLWYCEQINATNPCGEIPLPPYGACNLGAVNLSAFVRQPFTPEAHLDLAALRQTVATATRVLDNVIDLSQFPLATQREQAQGSRRIGLGITGLADALMLLGCHYADAQARVIAAETMQLICHTAYETSINLAREKGGFPFYERDNYLRGEFIQQLPAAIQEGIARHGLRNSHLTAIAPTGSISLLANNVSSGVEPVFAFRHQRRIRKLDGQFEAYHLVDPVYEQWRQRNPQAALPPYFVEAHTLSPTDHLEMAAALQPFVDNAISKTINVPEDYRFAAFRDIYQSAFSKGLKGCTTFRSTAATRAILSPAGEDDLPAGSCCGIEREGD